MSDYRIVIKEDDDVVNLLKELIRLNLIRGSLSKEIGENYLVIRRSHRSQHINNSWLDFRVYYATQEFIEQYNDSIKIIHISKEDLLYALNIHYLMHNELLFDDLLSKG